MLIPAFIVFLIPLRTCCREERQVPFSIHFCADTSQLDFALLVQNPLHGEVTGQNHKSGTLRFVQCSLPVVRRQEDLSAVLVCWGFSRII